jgi:hypothetical protein
MVAREQGFAQGKADVATEMTRCVDDPEAPVWAGDGRPVLQVQVRGKVTVETLTMRRKAWRKPGHDRAAARGSSSESKNWRARCLGQSVCEGRMIKMRMGNEDVADPLTRADGGKDAVEMGLQIGARIDNGNF